ncbi:MAG TPA: hypothetical protein VNT01_02895 [Symbiobacteriaceae bacterium]|nr:hypothetical protein [Symbiobacteriaceae bacterium]
MPPRISPAPVSQPKIQVPLVAKPANTPEVRERTRSMLSSYLKVETPAIGTLTALSGIDLADAATKNILGTPRPSAVMCGLDETNTYLFLVPVKAGTVGATEVRYLKGMMTMNLYPLFSSLDRLVPEDYREYYPVQPTPGEVTIDSVKGWGVYINLTEFTKEKITRLSDEEKARRVAKLRETLAKKKAAKQAAQESAPGAESPTEEQE